MDNELRKYINKLILSKRYDEAKNICKDYLKNNSPNGEIYYYLGIIYSFSNVLRWFSKCIFFISFSKVLMYLSV